MILMIFYLEIEAFLESNLFEVLFFYFFDFLLNELWRHRINVFTKKRVYFFLILKNSFLGIEGIEKYYDVTFEVNKTTIKAVRFILEYTSQYFKDLFSTLPHFQSPLHTIVIEDTTPEAFQTIIIYLSYGEVYIIYCYFYIE